MPARGSWWYAEVEASADRPPRLVSVSSTSHPDGQHVAVSAADVDEQIGADADCWVSYGWAGQVTGLQVTARVAPRAPGLWFLEVRESAAQPPAVNLLAFSEPGVAPGELLDLAAFSNTDIDGSAQLGAIRWYPATGEVDQIYVAPEMRRRSIGSALISASATLSVARGWPRLWGDGQRTELGEQFRNGHSWWFRAAELTHVAPPMTPPDGRTASK